VHYVHVLLVDGLVVDEDVTQVYVCVYMTVIMYIKTCCVLCMLCVYVVFDF